MKKRILLLCLLLSALFVNAQQYVSTTASNRNVILEEFTGRNCGYCTDGHRIANEIMAQHPDRVWAINIHTGGYAPTSYPNMNTSDGATIASGFSISGYPCGVVNRSTSSALSRSQWASTANTQLGQASEVNVAGQVVVNPGTRTATITVEAYYTGNSAESTNYLTVAMLQDSILGSQADYGNYNPTQWLNGQYVHMHILRDVITPTWGEAITPTTAGTLVTKTYTYTIPENIGSPNGVDVDLDNIFFLAWVSEKYQGTPTRPILSACKLMLSQANSPNIKVYSVDPEEIDNGVNEDLTVTMKNFGSVATTGNTTVTITSSDQYLTIVQGTATFGAMAANGGTSTVNNAFTVRAAANTPNNHVFTVNVAAVNNGVTYHDTFELTAVAPCEAPTNLSATASGVSIHLTWTASSTATSYNVYRGTTQIASNVTGTSYTDSNLSYSTQYCYTVKGNCQGGILSDPSNQSCATTENPCNAPTGLTTSIEGYVNVVLNWNASTYAVSYNVLRNNVVIATGITTTTYTDQNLENGNYCYRVTSVCPNGTSDPSSQSCQTIDAPCDEPRNLEAEYVYNGEGDFGVMVEWDAPADRGLAKYNVYRSPNGNTYTVVGEVESSSATHFEYFDEVGHGTYFYQVRALYEWGNATCESDPAHALDIPSNNCVMVTVTSVGETSSHASIYPNPATDKIEVESNEAITSLKVYNLMGTMTYSASDCGKHAVIDLSSMPAGVYFVQVITSTTNQTRNFVKE